MAVLGPVKASKDIVAELKTCAKRNHLKRMKTLLENPNLLFDPIDVGICFGEAAEREFLEMMSYLKPKLSEKGYLDNGLIRAARSGKMNAVNWILALENYTPSELSRIQAREEAGKHNQLNTLKLLCRYDGITIAGRYESPSFLNCPDMDLMLLKFETMTVAEPTVHYGSVFVPGFKAHSQSKPQAKPPAAAKSTNKKRKEAKH
jgi:hypothetical protein